MTTVAQTPPQMPSILSMVQRVKRECGETIPTTLVGTTNKGDLVTLDALNDAANDIYHRKRWEWNESLYGLKLESGHSQYPLPYDFMRMAQEPKLGGTILQYMEEADFYEVYGTGHPLDGGPLFYTVHGSIFEMSPTPNDEIVSQYPILGFKYYRMPPTRLDGSDNEANLNLPPQFLECIVAFGKWKLKELLEYPDAVSDYRRYNETLGLLMAADRSLRPMARMQLPKRGRSVWNG